MSARNTVIGSDPPQDSVQRRLEVIEGALDGGDVETAMVQLRHLRRELLSPLEQAAGDGDTMVGGVALTGQEIATLRRLPDGSLSQKDIARAMGVSRNTLKTHLKSLYLKLGAHCRSEAIHRAREVGLLPPSLTLVATTPNDERHIA